MAASSNAKPAAGAGKGRLWLCWAAWACLVVLMIPLYAAWLFPGLPLGLGHGIALHEAASSEAPPPADAPAALGAPPVAAPVSTSRLASAKEAAVISPADTAAVALTAATLVLGGVAFVISLLAFFGYQGMRDLVARKAEESAQAHCDSALQEMEAKQEALLTELRQRQEDFEKEFARRLAATKQADAEAEGAASEAEALARALATGDAPPISETDPTKGQAG